MKTAINLPVGLALIALSITACEQMPSAGGPSVVVLDLESIANATGFNTRIEEQTMIAREEANAQLNEVAGNLEAQLNEERQKLGDSASETDQQNLRQLTAQAQQQFAQAQTQAQQQVQQFQNSLVGEFREQVQPIAAAIAAERGADVALITSPSVFWFDTAADITDEVLAVMRAQESSDALVTPPDTGTAEQTETSDVIPEADAQPESDVMPEAATQPEAESQ